MKNGDYREYLERQGIPGEAIEKQMKIVEDFVTFLTGPGSKETISSAGKEVVEKFARKLIAEGRNTLENFSALCEYADWRGQRRLYVALIELMDCHNAMAVLANEMERRHGRGVRDQIFLEDLPPLGVNEKERWAYTRMITERMASLIAPDEIRAVWFQVQHGIPAGAWRESEAADKQKFRQCGNIDEFLSLKRRERDAMLTRLRDEDKLWYTVSINDEVLDFIQSDPEMEVGRREGNKIYISKVPYNAVRYLHAREARLKRYYACHCPLVREAILQEQPISPEVCNCSLGHASHYLAGLGQELKGEVLESAVKGDIRCRFVFHLPTYEIPGALY